VGSLLNALELRLLQSLPGVLFGVQWLKVTSW
jgi:hypothetical protein